MASIQTHTKVKQKNASLLAPTRNLPDYEIPGQARDDANVYKSLP
jgi:hypothetical protein